MNDDFKPKNVFQQWVKGGIESLENKFENHLSHHQLYLKILLAPVIVGIILIITAQVLTLMRLNIPIK